jgi:hypothetical protein
MTPVGNNRVLLAVERREVRGKGEPALVMAARRQL